MTDLLRKIKAELHVWFFYGFILTFSLTIRKVIWHFPLEGLFNEHSGLYFYLSDIFLVATLILWVISLYNNKKDKLSSYKLWKTIPIHRLSIFLPLILAVFSFLSIFWSENKIVAIFRSIKLLELYLLYIYIYFQNVPRGTFLKNILRIIIAIGLIQSVIAIWQFIVQHSIGLRFFQESIISPFIPGVAKVILNDNIFIRAYGLMPHPNILGCFLLFSIILTILCKKLFHVEQFRYLLKLVLFIQCVALILTFSKSAMIGLIISIIYTNVPRGTLVESKNLFKVIFNNIKKLFHVEQYRRWILSGAIIIVLVFIIIKPNLSSLFTKSLGERLFYLNVSRGTILDNPVLGVGIGQFVMNIPNYVSSSFEAFQYQPVHNVFLLIWSELGIIGLGLFIIWIWKVIFDDRKMFHVCLSGRQVEHLKEDYYKENIVMGDSNTILEHNNNILSIKTIEVYFEAILVGFLFIMLFDHYFWDIWQGQIIFWLTMGIIAGIKFRH